MHWTCLIVCWRWILQNESQQKRRCSIHFWRISFVKVSVRQGKHFLTNKHTVSSETFKSIALVGLWIILERMQCVVPENTHASPKDVFLVWPFAPPPLGIFGFPWYSPLNLASVTPLPQNFQWPSYCGYGYFLEPHSRDISLSQIISEIAKLFLTSQQFPVGSKASSK